MPTQPKSIKDFSSLLDYLHNELGWPFLIDEDEEENAFDWQPDELGLDKAHSVKIKRVRQLRPSDDAGPWGIFYVEFESKRLPVVVLRRVLRALALKARQSANAAQRKVWLQNDLLFICAGGESGQRGLTFAHFRAVQGANLAQLRTFGWDERETQFYSLQNLNLEKLKWENHANWGAAFTAEHGRTIKDARELSVALAHFARRTRQLTLALYDLEKPDGKLHLLHTAFQKSLISDLTTEAFADTIAQTVAYGLFAGRATGDKLHDVGLGDLAGRIPETNPFLRELFNEFARLGADYEKQVDFDDLGVVDLVEFLNDVPMENILNDFGRQSGGGEQDPVIHFYEGFLKEYDAKVRMQRGVIYTPKPVVDFIVRGVDHLLKTELDCPLGLADSSKDDMGNFKVTILEPAVGTGTFFVSVIELIHATMCTEWKSQGRREKEFPALWDEYVSRDLLPRLFGFELMMASYTVAHLKIGLKLAEYGYQFKKGERLRVYLTNTLEESQQLSLDLPGFLSHEAQEAQRVKKDTVITVILGNPPYAGHSANENVWIRNLLRSKLTDDADSYFKVDGADLGERNPKWLNDDYVKFTRYAQYRLAGSPFGVMGFITNHGYLDNPTFRGMRQSLTKTFAQMWQLDLHGNAKKKEKTPDGRTDENVFEIQQGVSLNFGVKNASAGRLAPPDAGDFKSPTHRPGGLKPPATGANSERASHAFSTIKREKAVHHADLWGTQEEKYAWLRAAQFENAPWQPIEAKKPNYLFVPQNAETRDEYECGVKVTEIFGNGNPAKSAGVFFGLGICTHNDLLHVGFTQNEVHKRVEMLANPKISDSEILNSLPVEESRYWETKRERAKVRQSDWQNNIWRLYYRPFDWRYIYYEPSLMEIGRGGASRQVMPHANKANSNLMVSRGFEIDSFQHVLIGDAVAVHHAATRKEGNYLFPLYLYNPPINWDTQLLGSGQGGRRANLAPGFVAQLGTALKLSWVSDGRGDGQSSFGPEDVLAYIYAIFHAPSYRSRYAEFLKIDFPRVPLTTDAALFWQLVECGRALISAHLMEGGGLKPPAAGASSQRASHTAEAEDLSSRPKDARHNQVPEVSNLRQTGQPQGEVAPGYPKYEGGRVYINGTSYFEGVSEAVWNFHIGGYQVAHKWLKDRKGRTLSEQDAAHYHGIVAALEQTIALMAQIDGIIEAHGGWPLAGSDTAGRVPTSEDVKAFFATRGEAKARVK